MYLPRMNRQANDFTIKYLSDTLLLFSDFVFSLPRDDTDLSFLFSKEELCGITIWVLENVLSKGPELAAPLW